MKFIQMIILVSALILTIILVSESKENDMQGYSEYFLSYVAEDGYTFVNGDESVFVDLNELQGYEMHNSIWIKFDDNNWEVEDIKLH